LPGFSGAYEPDNWTLTNSNADGNVNTALAPNSITLTGGDNGGDDGGDNSGTTDYTIAAVADGTLSFAWNYTSLDQDGPQFDPFLFLLNGTTQLSDDGGGSTQLGNFSISLLTGETFGFRIATVNNLRGGANVTISNFDITPVPFEFSPVLGLGVLGGVWAGKRFLKSRKTK